MKTQMLNRASNLSAAIGAVLAVAACAVAPSAQAYDFGNDGGLTGSLDTTVSFGTAWRVASQNPALVGVADGGTGRSVNIDDGDANYNKGDQFSEAFKVTSELSLKYNNYGFFARGSGLYDLAVMDMSTRRTPLSAAAKDLAGHYIRLLDAFAYGKWDIGQSHPIELRVGKQIISWGESTFIQGGLSGINPVDVSALRVPGSELKEAFLPQQMVKASLGTSANTSIEAFYLLGWRRTEIEPDGTYFSTNDYVSAGGSHVFLGFGGFSDQGTDFRPLGGPVIQNFQGVPEGPRIDPSDSGQFGFAFRWFMPNLGSGTELSFYFTNYASHLPLISGRAGTVTGISNAAGAATAMEVTAQALVAGLPESAAIQAGAAAGYQAAHASGGTISASTLASYATIGANTYLGGGNLATQVNNFATHEFAQTASYFVEYPDNLQTFAVAFNTQLGTSGVALQGQVEYRKDTPLQFDDVELLFSALTPLEQALYGLQNPGAPFPTTCDPAIPTLTRCGQLGAATPGGVIHGWGRYNVWQEQASATKAFSQLLGAQQLVVVAEVGATNVVGMPDKTTGGPNGQGLRFNGPGTSVSGNAALAYLHYGEVEPQNRFADPFSWGYRLAAKLDYPNLIGSWTVSPKLTWQQDVKGTTPGPGGNFVEGREALSLGLGANLQNRWQLELTYTKYAGAGRYNDMIDRDWAAAAIKYSF
jgi:Protein of unknown function (DUF1302)